jgi:predicted dehydrogenase
MVAPFTVAGRDLTWCGHAQALAGRVSVLHETRRSRTRVALLGVGTWAEEAHLPALRAQADVDVVGCAGATLREAEAFAGRHGLEGAYGSLGELLDRCRPLDVLAVLAPDDVHAPAATAALERGVAVFCEKPLANDAAAAGELAALAAKHGLVASVGYSFRYSPALRAVKADLESGLLGEPWLVEIAEHNPQFHPVSGRALNWKADPAHAAAGALFEYGSHALDLAAWLAGDVTAVSTSFARVRAGAALDDIATLQLRFAGGAIGTLLASWVLSGGFPGIRLRLHGSRLLAEVVLDERVPGGERYRRRGQDGRLLEEVELEPLGEAHSAYARRHWADVLRALDAGEAPAGLPTFEDGARIQRVLEAALQATGRWVELA